MLKIFFVLFLLILFSNFCYSEINNSRKKSLIANDKSSKPHLEVSGIMTGEKNVAIINGEMVEEGDLIEQAKVIKIEKNYVRFEYQGHIFIKYIDISDSEGAPPSGEKKTYPISLSSLTNKLGMTRQEIEKDMHRAGKSVEYISGDIIVADILFDETVAISYNLTPTTKRCYQIIIVFPDYADYNRLSRALIAKYGEPTYPLTYYENTLYRSTAWDKSNLVILLIDGEIMDFPDTVQIQYTDKKMHYFMKQEEKALDGQSRQKL